MFTTKQVMTSLLLAAEQPTDGVARWATDMMERLGGPGAGLAVALENLFPPIPSEVILPLAGFAASRGDLGLVSAILWTTAGSVIGALVLYAIGAALGRHRMRALVAWLPLMKLEDVDKAEHWFQRHGSKAVFIGRLIPMVRSLISIPAGVERMSVSLFILLTGLGSLIWNSTLILAGHQLGEQWHLIEQYVGIVQKVVIVGAVAAVAWFVATRIRALRQRLQRPADEKVK